MANIIGTSQDDRLLGAEKDDLIEAGSGHDYARGEGGDDTILGGAGNDDLFGGAGDDRVEGGNGSDIMTGGAGSDVLLGGEGRDQFYGLTVGDTIDGGEGGEDFDRIFLDGLTPEGGRLEINRAAGNPENGTIDVYDVLGETLGAVTFQNIEKIGKESPPCFTPGTRIATAKGERKVENLKVGDRIVTRDNGIQAIRWIGAQDISGEDLERAGHLRPVKIEQGALGNDQPERDMLVSPNHRILVANDKTALYFEEREVLVAAKYLTGLRGVDIVDVPKTTYIHLMFDQHEVILSDGTWSESFQPGDLSLNGIGNAQRQEVLELFPELATAKGVENYASARTSLKKHEANFLVK